MIAVLFILLSGFLLYLLLKPPTMIIQKKPKIYRKAIKVGSVKVASVVISKPHQYINTEYINGADLDG
ncbi:hypothetical protein L1765_06215 [Microaerobacter geothermalis]|uniref:hypothetical protein n=1 Tax=Microaerobacter geothermalis TaxID=674972 RepID=UPI001F4247BA|nr:hypothetical protein [Microaerobacter geothermalis]MCF6093581.1 hypothetical protein [Microaerobacter geothermalis]